MMRRSIVEEIEGVDMQRVCTYVSGPLEGKAMRLLEFLAHESITGYHSLGKNPLHRLKEGMTSVFTID